MQTEILFTNSLFAQCLAWTQLMVLVFKFKGP